MKRFKELREELLREGGEMYPADEMTMKEVKIACYAANNILDRLENGVMIQRWQISAIVKAAEELSSVYTSMSADEEGEDEYDDEWEDEYDEEPVYVGFEYPSMYGEEVELKQNLTELFDKPYPYKLNIRSDGAEAKIKLPDRTTLNVMFLKGKNKWDMAFDRNGSFDAEDQGDQYKVLSTVVAVFMDFVNKVKPAKITFDADKDSTGSRADLYTRMLNRYADKMGYDFKVKNPMGDSILQYTLTKKSMKEEVELDEAMYVKTTPGQLEKAADKVGATWDKEKNAYIKNGLQIGYTKLKSKPGEARSYDHFIHRKLKEETDYKVTVDGLPDMYVKADNPSEVKANLRKVVKNPEMIRNVERIAKSSLQKMFRDKAAGKEEVTEGYNDPIHRKYISDTVHEYVSKDDPKHDKIVDHLHKAKNFGSKTVDSLSDHAGISLGAANAITKEVASNLKANFGTAQKTQTQAQRINAYLKQKQIGPRSKS